MKQPQESPDIAAIRIRQSSESVATIAKDGAQLQVSSMALLDPYHDRPRAWWGSRHTLAFLGFLGFSTVYAMRVNLSVAIVCMVTSQTKNDTDSSSVSNTCPLPSNWNNSITSEDQIGEFDWDVTTQGLILGSFFYGYLFTNLPGGRMAEYFGGKRVLGLGILLTAIFTILSPICARISASLFIAIRIIEGLCEGVTFPAMNILLATWIPPIERAKFSSLVYAGAQFGTVVTLPVSGWLCDSDFLGGWPSVFYVFGGLGLLWSIAWFIFVFDNPDTHPRISQEEKKYILNHCLTKKKPVSIPWKSLATSLPLWCVAVVHFGQNWGFYTLLTELPTYLKEIQHFDMKSNGIVSALPYLMMWISSLLYSSLIDRLLTMEKISLLTARKVSMIIGMYGPMLGLVAMCFVDCDKNLAIIVLCIAMGLNGAIYCGYMCSHQDLAPNLAGTLMGITNSVATIPGFVTPIVTGAITEHQTLGAWRTVFLISAAVYFVTNIGYLLFVPANVQPWNDLSSPPEDEQKRY